MLKRANKTTTNSSINGILDDFFRETPRFDMWDDKIKLKIVTLYVHMNYKSY